MAETTRRQPLPHQGRVLDWARGRDSVGLFLKMRLGKSLIASRWVEAGRGDKVLIEAPLSVIPTWRRELAAEGVEYCELTGTRERRMRALERAGRDHRVYLINPEGLVVPGGGARGSDFAQAPWDVVVVDESTCIRNPKALVTKVHLRELSSAPRKALLSGLPNPEGWEDMVTQMLFLRGEFMGHSNYWSWRQEHCQPSLSGWEVRPKSVAPLRAEVRAHSVFMTRAEAGLPDEKLRTTRWVQLPRAVLAEIRRAERDFECAGRATANRLVAMNWMQRLAGGRFPDAPLQHDAKFRECALLARGEFRGQHVVAFCRYNAEVRALAACLGVAGVPATAVVGSDEDGTRVDVDERDARIQHWRSRGGWLVAQTRCVDRGQDLSEADTAVFVSNYWDNEVRQQAEERVAHPKKSRPSLVVDIAAEGTLDEDVVDALADKRVESTLLSANVMDRLARRVACRRDA